MLCACHNLSSFSSFQDYIARFGHGSAKLARQAQSKEKVLAKMVAGGLTEKVSSDKVCSYGNAMKCPNLFPTILHSYYPSLYSSYHSLYNYGEPSPQLTVPVKLEHVFSYLLF